MADDEETEEKADEQAEPAEEKKASPAREGRKSPPRKRPGAKRARVAASEPAEEAVLPKPPPSTVTVAEERSARRALTAGVSLATLGLALVGVGPSEAGMAVTLAGLLTLIYGIHTFGRLGPDPAK